MLTDVHVHLLAASNRMDPPEAFREEGETLLAEMSVPAARAVWERATAEHLLAEMERSSVDRSLVFGFPWRSASRCRADNDYVEECVKNYPERLRGLAVFQPQEPGSVQEVTRRLESGRFCGVKIKAQWQGHSLEDFELWRPVLAEVERLQGICLIHVEQIPKPSQGNGPREAFNFAAAFPHLTIVAAHFGAMLGLYEAHPPYARVLKNVVYDTAMARPATLVSGYVAAGVSDKLMFGSDFPMHSQQTLLASCPTLPGLANRFDLSPPLSWWQGP